MKILWMPPKNYYVGASGKCEYCFSIFELEEGDKFVLLKSDEAYTDEFGATRKSFVVRLGLICPACGNPAVAVKELV
jgi:hypothetical protein